MRSVQERDHRDACLLR